MMKQSNILRGLLGTLAGAALLFSCSSEEMDENDGITHTSPVAVLAQENEQVVQFNINYDVLPGCRVVFDVYAENPYQVTSEGYLKKENVSPLISAMTDENGNYDLTRIIPGGVKEVYVTSACLGVPALLHGVVASGRVTPQEINLTADKVAEARSTAFPVHYLGKWNDWGRPDYVDPSMTASLSWKELKSIASALPEWRPVKTEYATAEGICVEKEAEVWISLLSAKSLFCNALGYYCYTDGMKKEDVTEVIALPRTDLSVWSKNGLKYGEYVKLKYYNQTDGRFYDKFPAGTHIGWVLHRSGYQVLTGSVTQGTHQFYSNDAWNPEKSNRNHTAIFTTSEGNLIVGFEDMCNEGRLAGDNDCNDLVFHVAARPEGALSAAVRIPSNGGVDQVEEEVDAVQPLAHVIDVPDGVDDGLMMASKSRLNVVDGYVMGVKDVLYIAGADAMQDMLSYTYDTDEFYRKVVVRTTVKFSRQAAEEEKKKGRTVVRTTVKNTSWDVETSRAVGAGFDNAEELILNAVLQNADILAGGGSIRIELSMEFEEGVPYDEFIRCIHLPPYTPFVKDAGK